MSMEEEGTCRALSSSLSVMFWSVGESTAPVLPSNPPPSGSGVPPLPGDEVDMRNFRGYGGGGSALQ